MTRDPPSDPSEYSERIAGRATPFRTTDPAADLRDLADLEDVLRPATVVGLGEATHGTREFFRLKHRLLRLLIERLDLRLIGLEANFSETLAVDRYVVTGADSAEAALASIPTHQPIWETEEMVALLEWLREFNASRPADDRVRCFGFDAQFTAGAAEAIRGFFERVDPEFLDSIDDTLGMLREEGLAVEDDAILDDRLAATDRLVSAIRTRLGELEDSYRDAASDAEWRLLDRHLRVVEQVRELSAIDVGERPTEWYETRDRAMAENAVWMVDHEPSDRVALWGHNGHVARGLWQDAAPRMGTVLGEEFDEAYYAVGFDFGSGSFQAVPASDDANVLQEWSLEEPAPDALATAFEAVGSERFFVDVSAASTDQPLGEFLSREWLVHSVGSVFDPDGTASVPMRATEEFDGLVFVTETSRARPLDGR